MSILFSDDYPVVVLAFRVRTRGSTWLDGTPTGRIYVEKRDMEQQTRELIEGGRLTLDPEGGRKPVLVSVGGAAASTQPSWRTPRRSRRRRGNRGKCVQLSNACSRSPPTTRSGT